jgi:hypothetical protein
VNHGHAWENSGETRFSGNPNSPEMGHFPIDTPELSYDKPDP